MVKVKICGVTNIGDAKMAAELGADYIGNIVGIPSSPRSISIEESRDIFSRLPDSVKGVVVMAPKNIDSLRAAAEKIQPCCVQLHGFEDFDFARKAKEELSCGVIKAVHIGGEDSIEVALEYSRICDAVLLDTPSRYLGGSGETHNWNISKRIVGIAEGQVFLAGGLNPENAGEAVKRVSPYCLDTSSGVERVLGKKDYEKVKKFIDRAKNPP